MSLYTRQASNKASLWIDTEIKRRNDDLRIERYVKKDDTPLPHYKCVFITKKIGPKKELVMFAYIGSANLTEAAFFKKGNIEFAAFFDKIRSGSEIDKIFNEIKNNNWEERIPLRSKNKSIDESEQGYGEIDNHQDNFEIRNISKILCKKLKTKKWQKELEDSYRHKKQIKLFKCTINVIAILDGIFDLHVSHKEKELDFPLYIRRDNISEIYSFEDTKELIDKLLEKSVPITRGNNGKARKKGDKKGAGDNIPRNIRFPIPNFILDKGFFAEKKDILGKLSDSYEWLTGNDKNLVDMWCQIFKQLP